VSIVARTAAGSRQSHPSTALLVFEVAGESLRKDRLTKAGLYARAGIPEYVIVNLAQGCLEVDREPDAPARRYRTVTTLGGSDRFESAERPRIRFSGRRPSRLSPRPSSIDADIYSPAACSGTGWFRRARSVA
jgi:Putative restriction endonuclease